jgi:hypothetical protein
MADILPIGSVVALQQNLVYALPNTPLSIVFDAASPTVQRALTSDFATPIAIILTNGQANFNGGGFLKVTTASPGNILVQEYPLSSALTGGLTIGGSATPTVFNFSATGAVNDLAFNNADVIRCSNASDATISGLAAGVDGQHVTIICQGGAGNILLAHNQLSIAANRLFNRVTSGTTPLCNGKGSASFRYNSVLGGWQMISHAQGDWLAFPYVGGNFFANGSMTWTVESTDVSVDRYLLVDRVLHWNFRLLTTTVGGTVSTELQRTIPNGYSVNQNMDSVGFIADNAVAGGAYIYTVNNTTISIAKMAGGNYTLSTNNTKVGASLALHIT